MNKQCKFTPRMQCSAFFFFFGNVKLKLDVFGWLMWALSLTGRQAPLPPFALPSGDYCHLSSYSRPNACKKVLGALMLCRKPWALSLEAGGSALMSHRPCRQRHHPPDCFVLTTLVFQQRIQARAWTDSFRKYRNEEMGLKVCLRQVFLFAVSN